MMYLTNNNKIKIFISSIFIALLVTGCDIDQNLGDEAARPDNYTDGRVIGTIHGVVKDYHSGARLKDIVVTTTVKGEIHWVFTNDVGHYAITNLSPGKYELTFSGSDGYAIMSTEENINIPTLQEAGVTDMATSEDFHYTATQDMSLYSLNAGLTGTVYTEQDDENTTLAGAGVTVIANYAAAFSPSWYSAVTDSNGVYSFSNLPADETNITTMPFSDGTYDYEISSDEGVELMPGETVTNDPIILQIETAEPFVLTNNFENNDFGLTESLTMTFSKTMDASSFDITLSGEGEVVFVSSWTNDITLTIDPLVTLQASTTYSLSLNGKSQDNNDFSASLSFVTEDSEIADTTAPAQVTGFAVDEEGDWTADYNTTSITFKWNTVDGADGYIIWASDNQYNPSPVTVGIFEHMDYVTDQSGNVVLPSQFDYYDDDDTQTPFTGGTDLTFQIVAFNDAGEGTYSASVTVGDETSPSSSLNQSGTADNPDSTSTQSFTVDLSANEYLSATGPTFGFVESGGDTNYVLPNTSVSLDWDSDIMGVTFTVVVPAGKDGSGDKFFITNLKDASENASSDTVSVTLK